MMEHLLISACLLGAQCRYDGQSKPVLEMVALSAEYRHGAEQALHLARLCGCKIALLKERSPSCGSGTIYDGTFTGGLTAGDGVTAALLRENGITVYGESEIGRLLEEHGQSMEAMF